MIGEQVEYAFKSFKELLKEQTQVYEIPVPEIEANIRYGKMTVLDWMEVRNIEDDDEARRHSLYLMWKHGDPTVEKDDIMKMPFDVVEAVYNRMMENTPFLHLRWLIRSPEEIPPPEELDPSSKPSPDTN